MLKKFIAVVLLAGVAFLIAALMGWVPLKGAADPGKVAPELAAEQPQSSDNENSPPPKPLAPMPACEAAKPGGPEEVVRSLYSHYPFAGDKVIKNEPQDILEKYLDKPFASALLMDQRCEENTGDMCQIDADIMYMAQDGEISELSVCKMDPVEHTVDVHFRNMRDPQVVTYALRDTVAGWRIADISTVVDGGVYSVASSLRFHHEELLAGWHKAQVPLTAKAASGVTPVLTSCKPAKPGGPEDLIRKLYDQYPWKDDVIAMNESRDVLASYFDAGLLNLIVTNREKRAKNNGSYLAMPNIIINHDAEESQEIRGFQICAMDASTNSVRVQFLDGHTPALVTYRLANTASGWRISDVYYNDASQQRTKENPYDWSLRDQLSDE